MISIPLNSIDSDKNVCPFPTLSRHAQIAVTHDLVSGKKNL